MHFGNKRNCKHKQTALFRDEYKVRSRYDTLKKILASARITLDECYEVDPTKTSDKVTMYTQLTETLFSSFSGCRSTYIYLKHTVTCTYMY